MEFTHTVVRKRAQGFFLLYVFCIVYLPYDFSTFERGCGKSFEVRHWKLLLLYYARYMIDKRVFFFIFYASVDRELMFRHHHMRLIEYYWGLRGADLCGVTPSLTLSLLKLCQSVRLSHVGHTSVRKFA